MSTTIDIVFAGLIAFLPNSSDDPVSMKAYLLDAKDHERVVEVFGGDSLELTGDLKALGCTLMDHGRLGKIVSCNLSNVHDAVISIEPRPEEKRRHLKKGRPRKEKPEDSDENSRLDWLLRLENVQAGTGHVQSWKGIKAKVGALFDFGWESAQVCALDGGEREGGESRVIEFLPKSGDDSDLRQAVAESLLFTSRVKPGHLRIRIRRRESGKEVVVSTRCGGGTCLVVSIDNSAAGSCAKPREAQGALQHSAGDHFKYYYGLVREDGNRRTPHAEDYKCVEDDHKIVDRALFECAMRFLRQAPDVEGCVRNRFGDQQYVKQKTFSGYLEECIAGPVPPGTQEAAASAESYGAAFRFLFGPRKVQDRIICPPTLLEP